MKRKSSGREGEGGEGGEEEEKERRRRSRGPVASGFLLFSPQI